MNDVSKTKDSEKIETYQGRGNTQAILINFSDELS